MQVSVPLSLVLRAHDIGEGMGHELVNPGADLFGQVLVHSLEGFHILTSICDICLNRFQINLLLAPGAALDLEEARVAEVVPAAGLLPPVAPVEPSGPSVAHLAGAALLVHTGQEALRVLQELLRGIHGGFNFFVG